MSSQLNTTLSDNLLPFIAYFEKRNIQWKQVADKYNIPTAEVDESLWLSSAHIMQFLNEMSLITNTNLGYEVGKNLSLSNISPSIDTLVNSCNDLEGCIHKLIEIMSDLNNHVIVWTEEIDGRWYLCHRGFYSPRTVGYEHTEWFRTFALVLLCRNFLGEIWVPLKVFMSSPSNIANQRLAGKYTFNCEFGAIQVPLKNNFKPLVEDIPNLEWKTKITRLANTYALLPFFTSEWFGRFLGVSKRTLHRQLRANNTSFKRIRDEARNRTARRLLSDTPLTPKEVAWRCGYSDLSNFNRAFKTWNNCTPSQYKNMTYSSIG